MKADDEALKLYSRFCDYLKNISRESTFHYDTFWPTYNAQFCLDEIGSMYLGNLQMFCCDISNK